MLQFQLDILNAAYLVQIARRSVRSIQIRELWKRTKKIAASWQHYRALLNISSNIVVLIAFKKNQGNVGGKRIDERRSPFSVLHFAGMPVGVFRNRRVLEQPEAGQNWINKNEQLI